MFEDDDDEFAPLGTAFAPLEADEIVSRKPEIDQTVRDERGRRRFHGAFTGGFSAGYWNTVGSAEGFTPQIFSSSRSNKYDRQKATKPEDYMDDEDFGSFGIAPKRIHTKDDFVENSSFAGLRDTSITFDDVIKSVFAPAKESIGMRLFRKMKRHVKMEQRDRQRDLFLMEDHSSRSNSNSRAKETLQYETKGDLHGLGYNSMLDPSNFLYGDPNSKALAKPDSVSATLAGGRRLKISGEAFGYGALEDEDDYMMGAAVYSKDDMSQYDFALGGVSTLRDKPKQKRPGPCGTITGNTLELDGFDKAAKATNLFNALKVNFRLPDLPRNWRPKRRGKVAQTPKKSRWDMSAEGVSKPPEPKEKADSSVSKPQQQSTLNANLRAVILGEEVVHKMGIARSNRSAEPLPTEKPKEVQHSAELAFDKVLHTPSQPKPQVQKLLSGFLASRFTHGSSALDDPAITAGLSTFKDLSSMSGFDANQRKSSQEQGATTEEQKPTRTSFEWHPHKLLCKRFGIQNPFPLMPDFVGIVSIDRGGQKTRNMTSAIQDVKSSSSQAMFSGLFGNLGQLGSFSPAVSETTACSINPALSKSKMPPNSDQPLTTDTTLIHTPDNKRQTRHPVVHEEDSDEDEEKEPEKPNRPPIDLFKSIFASDEEDSGEEVEEDGAPQPENNSSSAAKQDKRQLNGAPMDSKKSKSNGIFTGVDFVQLNQTFNPCLKATVPEKPKEQHDDNDVQLDDDFFGPALPPPSTSAAVPIPSVQSKSSQSSSQKFKTDSTKGSECDKSKRHKGKKHKKDKKKKKSKRKSSVSSKKSSKDRRKRKRHSSDDFSDSSDSSDESPEDQRRQVNSPEVPIKKLDAQLMEIIKKARYPSYR